MFTELYISHKSELSCGSVDFSPPTQRVYHYLLKMRQKLFQKLKCCEHNFKMKCLNNRSKTFEHSKIQMLHQTYLGICTATSPGPLKAPLFTFSWISKPTHTEVEVNFQEFGSSLSLGFKDISLCNLPRFCFIRIVSASESKPSTRFWMPDPNFGLLE